MQVRESERRREEGRKEEEIEKYVSALALGAKMQSIQMTLFFSKLGILRSGTGRTLPASAATYSHWVQISDRK